MIRRLYTWVGKENDQWSQFEEFPKFMEGVQEVKQLDDTHLHWKAQIGGKDKHWNAVVTEQRPDERIAWKSTDGVRNAGVVTVYRLADQKSKVMLQIDYEPESAVENVGDAVGVVSMRVAGRRIARSNSSKDYWRVYPAPSITMER
jgi:uncharacterized membrane protein